MRRYLHFIKSTKIHSPSAPSTPTSKRTHTPTHLEVSLLGIGKQLEIVVGPANVDVGADVVLLNRHRRLEVAQSLGKAALRLQSVTYVVEKLGVPLVDLQLVQKKMEA